jgi:hypothetical protein
MSEIKHCLAKNDQGPDIYFMGRPIAAVKGWVEPGTWQSMVFYETNTDQFVFCWESREAPPDVPGGTFYGTLVLPEPKALLKALDGSRLAKAMLKALGINHTISLEELLDRAEQGLEEIEVSTSVAPVRH